MYDSVSLLMNMYKSFSAIINEANIYCEKTPNKRTRSPPRGFI